MLNPREWSQQEAGKRKKEVRKPPVVESILWILQNKSSPSHRVAQEEDVAEEKVIEWLSH